MTTTRYTASSFTFRAAALGLAGLVSLALLGAVGQVADHQHDSALLAQSSSTPTQVVVVIGKRLHS
jgi:hypothetical protein